MRQSTERFRTGLGIGLAFLIGVCVFFITFQIVSYSRGGGGQDSPLLPPVDRPASALAMPTLDPAEGQISAGWSLADQKGKVVVVNYFATWCPGCITEMPDLIKISNDYVTRGVVFAGVSLDRGDEQQPARPRQEILRAFVRSNKVPYPILLPPDNSIIWRTESPIPQTFIYDRQGRRAQIILGQINDYRLRATLDALLKEPDPTPPVLQKAGL